MTLLNLIVAQVSSSDAPLGWLTEAGAVGVLAYFCFAFMTGKLRTEKEINRVIEERDRALDLVYKSAEVAQAAVAVAEHKKG